MKSFRNILGAVALACAASCALDEPAFEPQIDDSGKRPIVFSGSINQEYATRANDAGFCNGDLHHHIVRYYCRKLYLSLHLHRRTQQYKSHNKNLFHIAYFMVRIYGELYKKTT